MIPTLSLSVYDPRVVEFVTVCTEYCIYVEKAAEARPNDFVDVMRKLIPLLYLKAALIEREFTHCQANETSVKKSVTEADYEHVRLGAHRLIKEWDDYLEVFVEDMKYSDVPIKKSISEDLADIYQDLRNFLAIYREGQVEATQAALAEVMDTFNRHWGQTAVNTLRALHDAHCQIAENEP